MFFKIAIDLLLKIIIINSRNNKKSHNKKSKKMSKTKKLIIILAAIAAAILILYGVVTLVQNYNRNKGLEDINGSIEQVDQHVRQVSDQIEQGQQQTPTTMQRPDPDGFCGTISWKDEPSAWNQMPISKEEFREMASESSYGYPAVLPNNQRIEAIIGALTVDQLYSDSPTQTVVWFTYKSDDGEQHHSKMLIQGSVKCEEKEDLKGLINAQTKCCGKQQITECTILFGGKLCSTPPCEQIVTQPCNRQKATPKNGCKSCDDARFGSSAKQFDHESFGEVRSTGPNKKLPVVE